MQPSFLSESARNDLISRGLPADADDESTRAWLRANIPGLARLFEFIDAVHKESDRGAVICAIAFLDDALEQAIRGFLHEMSKVSKSVLDALLTRRPQPPVGSFAVRTKLARALGLIDDEMTNALDGMRPMRNDAAHLGKPFSFEADEYNIKLLFAPLSEKEQTYLGAMHIVRDEGAKHISKRRIFQIAASSIYYRLNNIAQQPSFYAAIFKVGGKLSHYGPFDRYYDDLMREKPSESTENGTTGPP